MGRDRRDLRDKSDKSEWMDFDWARGIQAMEAINRMDCECPAASSRFPVYASIPHTSGARVLPLPSRGHMSRSLGKHASTRGILADY